MQADGHHRGGPAATFTEVRLRIIATGALLACLAACGAEAPTEYSQENEDAFLAACSDAAIDGIFEQRVCRCVYQEAEATIAFDRFLEINEQLADAESPVLPDDLLDLIADCVIEEGDL